MKISYLFVLLLLCLTLDAQQIVVTTLTEEFSGKLFLYDDKEDALNGLKSNLSDRLMKRLKKMGYSDDYIITLLKKVKYSDLNVVEKRVEMLKDNKRVKTIAFDLSGYASITIDENDVVELAEALKRFSPISEDEKIQYREALRNFLSLSERVRGLDVSILKLKLSEIIKSDILKQIQTVFSSDNMSFQVLHGRIVDIINNIETNKRYLGENENLKEVTKHLFTNIEFYYKRSLIDVTNYESAINLANDISRMIPDKDEEILKTLMFIVEFKWAENIQNIASSNNVEIARLFREVDGFLKNFSTSKFIRNVRNKLITRLRGEMQDEQLMYDSFQYILLIFDRLGLKEISSDIMKKCESVMSSVESASDEVSSKIEESFNICMKYSDPITKKRINSLKEKFLKSDRNRMYKSMLGNLAFLMRFVKYVDSIPFGVEKEKISSNKFSDFLNEGSFTSGCSCMDEQKQEDCVVFVYGGDQFELVLRFHGHSLYEIEVCNMNLKGRSSVLLSYLKENFKPLFKVSDIEEKDGTFDFEVKKDLILSVEKVGFFGSVLVYDKRYRPKIQSKISYSSPQSDNILKTGDCVEWECEFECKYRGKVEKIIAEDVQVIVTLASKASELNMRKRLKKNSVRRCQSF
ncbi:MAG: hypothetical protein N2746_08350 [Deltaproteobacteria bacterium]|nr:hypothetical protein [Deltaproteobacteria bacterium]